MNRKLVLAMALTLVLIGMLGVALKLKRVRAIGTVYIKSDGSVEPYTAPIQRIGNTYTFVDNINDSIVIQKDSIVIDGAGYTLQGIGNGTGIYLSWRNNITIKNIEIKAFNCCIELFYSSNNSLFGNNITNCEYGIRFYSSSNNSLFGNNITNCEYGIRFYSSSNNSLFGNNIIANYAHGIWLDKSSNNSLSRNRVTANNGHGIFLVISSNNTISGNNITANHSNGILITEYSEHNTIYGNNITQNESIGITLSISSNNTISGNNITNNGDYGVGLYWSSSSNTVYGNNITQNEYAGILFFQSSNNTISENNITSNGNYGVLLNMSSSNKFYHNQFINNTNQVYVEPDNANTWDEGYPSGGNYWSDYKERYPDAAEIDESGIWDTPYVIDENNEDNYPIVPELLTWTSIPLTLTVLTVAMSIYKRRLLNTPRH